MNTNVENEFSNQQILQPQIPSLSAIEFEPLSPLYARTHRLVVLVRAFIILLLLMVVIYQPFVELPSQLNIALSIIAAILTTLNLVNYVYVYFADPKKQYALREQDINYQSGLIFRKTVSQPILRIQHVELKRGPIDRKVGLANLQVFSAGGAMHTFAIPGLDYEHAEYLRQYLLNHRDLNQHG